MSSKNGKDATSQTPASPPPAPDKKVIATLFASLDEADKHIAEARATLEAAMLASLDEADKHIAKARATLEAAMQKRSLLLSNLAQAIAPETRFSHGGVVYTI